MKLYGEFAAHPDDDLKCVKQKEQEYDKLQKSELNRRIHELANIWISTYFSVDILPDEYAELQNELNPLNFPDWSHWREKDWFRQAQKMANEKSFFHWEIEFPEVFHNEGAPKDNPGWDVIIGNPPYGAALDRNERTYLGIKYETAQGYKNTGLQFIECSYKLKMKEGTCGLIVPKSLTYSQGWNKGVELILPGLIFLIDASKAFDDVLLEQVVIIFNKNKINSDSYKSAIFDKSEVTKYISIPKSTYSSCENLITSITSEEFEIFKKLNSKNFYFKNISTTFRGVPWQKYIRSTGNTIIFRGDHIERFRIIESSDFIDLEKINYSMKKLEQLKQPKIVSQNIVAHVTKPVPHIIITSALDKTGLLNLDTVNNTILTDKDYALEYLLCILNCNLTSWYTYRFIYNQAIRTMHFDDAYVGKIPIPQISFTTPKNRCATLIEEAKGMCFEFINEFKSTEKILNFISSHLEAKPEESDVIHFILVYLTERMIEMKKEKNNEIKDFLHWLEGEIGAEIADLDKKTILTKYYVRDFQTFADVLLKNRNKLKGNYDPAKRGPKERLQVEYSNSMEKLGPILKNIEYTESLINEIIYKLYGLTEEEIKIVEGNINFE